MEVEEPSGEPAEEPSGPGATEEPPSGISDKEREAWLVLLKRRDLVFSQRTDKTKHSGGRKGAEIINAENVIVKARIRLPESYPIAPALKKLTKAHETPTGR